MTNFDPNAPRTYDLRGGKFEPVSESYYWLTLSISASDLAAEMGCKVEDIEVGDYIGAIRDFGEVVKLEEVGD